MANLIGKSILIVDEVDDTRTTLEYAVKELEKDVEIASQKLGRGGEKTKFNIFVLHVSYQGLSRAIINNFRTRTRQRREHCLMT
jgi:hypoxanthine phosphoribosyltransferase